MEIDEDDAPYLDLQDDRKRQAYAMIKNWSFGQTRTFDPDLLEKIGMDVDFARVWHAVGWDGFVPVEENGSRLLTIQFLCTLREVDDFWRSLMTNFDHQLLHKKETKMWNKC